MALTGSDQHLTERDCGLNSEQISRCGAVKRRVRAAPRWLSTTAIAACAILHDLGDDAHRRVAQCDPTH
jgi:predicted HD phosphohydrolase